eukprot:56164-Chlamydomonas_euryale.AAC.1
MRGVGRPPSSADSPPGDSAPYGDICPPVSSGLSRLIDPWCISPAAVAAAAALLPKPPPPPPLPLASPPIPSPAFAGDSSSFATSASISFTYSPSTLTLWPSHTTTCQRPRSLSYWMPLYTADAAPGDVSGMMPGSRSAPVGSPSAVERRRSWRPDSRSSPPPPVMERRRPAPPPPSLPCAPSSAVRRARSPATSPRPASAALTSGRAESGHMFGDSSALGVNPSCSRLASGVKPEPRALCCIWLNMASRLGLAAVIESISGELRKFGIGEIPWYGCTPTACRCSASMVVCMSMCVCVCARNM